MSRFFVLDRHHSTHVVKALEVAEDFDNHGGEFVVEVTQRPYRGKTETTISATCWYGPDDTMALRTTEPLSTAFVAFQRLVDLYSDIESEGHSPTTHASVVARPSFMPGFEGFARLVGVA